MSALITPIADADALLAKALLNTRVQLGLTQRELADVFGVHRTAISRWADGGLRVHSKTGELALLLIRVYRSLFALFGGNLADMLHFLRTDNRHLDAQPLSLMQQVQGLVRGGRVPRCDTWQRLEASKHLLRVAPKQRLGGKLQLQ